MKVNDDGTKTVSYTYGGMTTTKTIDENGKVIAQSTTPYVKVADTSDSGVTVTQQSPMSVSIKEPVKKITTYTFNDGQEYTGYETNWEEAAQAAGNTSGLAGALSYPDYVDKNESWRYLNEMADNYGVDLDNPVGNGTVYTKEEGVNIIPDYSTPFSSPSYTGTGGVNTNGTEYNGYKGSEYGGYFDSARDNAYKKYEADKKSTDIYYDGLEENEDADYEKRQQEAYLANYFAGKKAEEALLENGIRGGLAQSSIIKNASDFENNYNENLGEHLAYLKEIEAERAKAYAEIEARLNEYFAELDVKEAEMAREEAADYNEYALKAYLAMLDKEEAEKDRQHEMEMKMAGLKQKGGL